MDVTITYLEMLEPPARAQVVAAEGVDVQRATSPTVEQYRDLYDRVGRDWRWIDRRILSDEQLAAIITDSRVEIYLLSLNGEVAGYAELDRRFGADIELAYFGLVPEFIGRGLGKFFLDWVIDRAWSLSPLRIWLHTCTLDHPRALTNYLKAGFVPYKEETK
jgi:GNAT superfamily N-acetyltransferase